MVVEEVADSLLVEANSPEQAKVTRSRRRRRRWWRWRWYIITNAGGGSIFKQGREAKNDDPCRALATLWRRRVVVVVVVIYCIIKVLLR